VLRWGALALRQHRDHQFLDHAGRPRPAGRPAADPLQAAGLLVTVSVLAVVGSARAPRLLGTLGWAPPSGSAWARSPPQPPALRLALGDRRGRRLRALRPRLGIGSVAANDMGTAVDEAIKATAAGCSTPRPNSARHRHLGGPARRRRPRPRPAWRWRPPCRGRRPAGRPPGPGRGRGGPAGRHPWPGRQPVIGAAVGFGRRASVTACRLRSVHGRGRVLGSRRRAAPDDPGRAAVDGPARAGREGVT
jgi:hypothetical protein